MTVSKAGSGEVQYESEIIYCAKNQKQCSKDDGNITNWHTSLLERAATCPLGIN